MNVSYAVAVALLDGDVLIEQFSAKRINSDDVWSLIDRTQTHHQSAYDELPVDERLTTQVRITLTDGSTHAATVAHPKGNGTNALTNPEIREKYRKLTNHTISPDRQSAIEHAVLNLDTLDDISEPIALLTPTVHSPID
jgi:2-methylcitrate dehydratase PrpD